MIVYAIAHAAYAPERAAPLAVLLAQLKAEGITPHVQRSSKKEHASVWARRIWEWADRQDADAAVIMNDDITIPAGFAKIVEALVAAAPGEVISLHAQGEVVRKHAEAGARFVTSYSLTGPAYILPRGVPRALLDYWATPGLGHEMQPNNEDGIAGRWMYSVAKPAWLCIPSIVQHDVSVPSTLGYDSHPHRQSTVPWTDEFFAGLDLTKPETWATGATPEWIENPAGWLPVTLMESMRRHALATCNRTIVDVDRPRVFIATPTRGRIHPEFAASVWRATHLPELDLVPPWQIATWWQRSAEIIRTRSRLVREFLATNGTHLWFIDDDQSFEPVVLRGMLAAKRDFVAAPYPQRLHDFISAEANDDGRSLEARTYRFHMQYLSTGPGQIDADWCFPIARIGLGCALLSRVGLERMLKFYDRPEPDFEEVAGQFMAGRPTPRSLAALLRAAREDACMNPPLGFDDQIGRQVFPTTALFHCPVIRRQLLSEDVAFCDRWRAMGEQIFCYVGSGSPINHHGDHTFRGLTESMGIRPIDEAAPAAEGAEQ